MATKSKAKAESAEAKAKAAKAKAQEAEAKALLDSANAELVALGIKVRAGQTSDEFDLFQRFAKELLAGKISTRGFVATIEAIEEQAGKFAEIRTSHANYLVLMAELSQVSGSPRSHSELYSLAIGLIRHHTPAHAKDAKKVALGQVIVEKNKGANGKIEKFAKQASAANASYAKAKANNKSKSENGKVESIALDSASIATFERLVKGAFDLDERVLASLQVLKATIEAVLELEHERNS